MFTDADFMINLAPVSSEPQLVLIPVSDEYGVMAVAKAFGNGKAACIVFAPAVRLGASFDGYVPRSLRKIVTGDFALRSGAWSNIRLSKRNTATLRETVFPLMGGLEELKDEDIEVIDMWRPFDIANSPAVASNTYRADERTPLERALSHLLGLKSRSPWSPKN
jgi:hypothetical protein